MLRDFLISDSGQGLAEYSLIMSLVVLAVIVIFAIFGQQVQALYVSIVGEWP